MLSVLECFRFDVPFLFFSFFFVCVSRIWFLEWERSRERRCYKYPHGAHISHSVSKKPRPNPIHIGNMWNMCGGFRAREEPYPRQTATTKRQSQWCLLSLFFLFLFLLLHSVSLFGWVGWLVVVAVAVVVVIAWYIVIAYRYCRCCLIVCILLPR